MNKMTNWAETKTGDWLTEFEDVDLSGGWLELVLIHGQHTSEGMICSCGGVYERVTQLFTLVGTTNEIKSSLWSLVCLLGVLEKEGFGCHLGSLHTALWSCCTLVYRSVSFTDQFWGNLYQLVVEWWCPSVLDRCFCFNSWRSSWGLNCGQGGAIQSSHAGQPQGEILSWTYPQHQHQHSSCNLSSWWQMCIRRWCP